MDFQKVKDLYLKSLINKATPEEEAQIETYLNANPTDVERLVAYAKTKIKAVKEYDTNQAMLKVKQQLKPKVVKGFFTLKSAAASILLIIGSLALYFNIKQNTVSNWTVYTSNEGVGYKNILLKDGSKIVLQNGSTLKVDAAYGEKETRLLSLNGQAFFEVQRDTTKPFIITTQTSEITVLGTSFNVNSSSNKSSIMVSSGKVKVSNLQNHNDIILVKNEGVFDDGKIMLKTNFKNENYQAWFTGKFSFKEEKIDEVVFALNTFYNNQFQLSEPFSSTCRLTADFDNQPIENVVEVLRLSCDIHVNKAGNIYKIEKNKN